MIPYFSLTSFHLGPITIHVWGLMVAIGILAGTWASARLAKTRGQNVNVIWDLAPWLILGGFIGARIAHVFIYEPGFYFAHPMDMLRIWDGGWSSIGGLVGGVAAGVWYLKHKKLDLHAYADTVIFGLPLGFAIGRLGCFFIHDHPGTLTHFVLGVQFPNGEVRHDLGLYESINNAILFVIFVVLLRKRVRTGLFAIVFLIYYGASRFLLDFLRINDARYFHLTPAQYGALAMVAAGIWFCLRPGLRL